MVQIIIDNYIQVSGLPYTMYNEIKARLTYPNPKYEDAKKFSRYKVIRGIDPSVLSFKEDKDTHTLFLPRGFLFNFMLYMGESKVPYDVVDVRGKFDRINTEQQRGLILRPSQEQMLYELSLFPSISCMLKAQPGVGKTVTGLEFARREQRKTLWITHTGELFDQAKETAQWVLGLSADQIGTIAKGKVSIGDFLTIGTVQTIYRKRSELARLKREFGTLIVDEVHHGPADTWYEVIHLFAPIFTLGLTATDRRNDGLTQMMLDSIGPVGTIADKELLKAEGILIVPDMLVYNTNLSFFGSTYNDLLKHIIKSEERNNLLMNLVEQYYHERENHVVLILTARVKHVQTLFEQAVVRGLNPLRLIGAMPNLERAAAREKLQQNLSRLLIATSRLLAEGFDHRPLTHLVSATPFRDTVLFEQMAGRLQRVSPETNKEYAKLIDLVDINTMLQKQASQRIQMAHSLDMEVFYQ